MVETIRGKELIAYFESKANQPLVPFTKYDDSFRQTTSEEKVGILDPLTGILNKLNGSIYSGKHYIARKSGDKMVQRVVYNRVDVLKSMVERAEVAINSGEEVTSNVLEGINLWNETKQYRKGGWSGMLTGEYDEGYKKYEWKITGLLSQFNTGITPYSFKHIGWLGGDDDQYFTPHIFNLRKGRTSDAVEFLTCLYVDIDNVSVEEAEERLSKSDLPKPTMMVSSGNGVHFYWFFKRPAQANGDKFCFINTWRKLATHFTKQLDGDLQCVDIARLLRIPGTINTKRGVMSEVVYFNDEVTYDIMELHNRYNVTQASILPFKQDKNRRVTTKQVKGVDKQPKSTLTPRRDYEQESDNTNGYSRQVKDDLLTLVELRNGNTEGYRHTILFYYKRFGATLDELEGMNNLFIHPVSDNDVYAISKSKGMVGKRPMRVTMMDNLNVTIEESSHLMQLVSADIVSSRRALKRLSEGYTSVFTSYSRYLNTLFSQAGKKSVNDKAKVMGINKTTVYRYQKEDLSEFEGLKEELVNSLIKLIEIAVDVVAIIERSLLNDNELQGYYDEIVNINKQLKVLNDVLAEGNERVGNRTRLRVVETKIKQLQTISA